MTQDSRLKTPNSPRIASLAWGRLGIDGFLPFRDAKVYPGGAREWDWTETGTHHVPGIQPADVEELLQHGARVIVLSRGQQERLQVAPETLELLKGRGIEIHVLETRQAVEAYNRLRVGTAVAGLFHTTC